MNEVMVGVRRRTRQREFEQERLAAPPSEDRLDTEDDELQDDLRDPLAEVKVQGPEEPPPASPESATPSLPFFDQIQAAFGRYDVSHVEVADGMDVAEITSRSGVHGLTIQGAVGLPLGADLFTAAHEYAHAVQQQRGISDSLTEQHEAQADAAAQAVVEGRSAETALSGGAVGGATGEGAGPQFRQDAPSGFGTEGVESGEGEGDEQGSDDAPEPQLELPEDTPPPPPSGGGEPSPAPDPATPPSEGSSPDDPATPPSVDLTAVPGGASRQEGSQEAVGNGATSLPSGPDARPDAVSETFKGMAPSVKSQQYASFSGAAGESLGALHADKHSGVPEFHATMAAESDMEDPPEIELEGPGGSDLEGIEALVSTDDPDNDPGRGPQLGRSPVRGSTVDRVFEEQSGTGDAKAAARKAIAKAQGGGQGISTDVEKPEFKLEGKADPKQIDDTSGKAKEDAAKGLKEAMADVQTGPGPELAQLVELDDVHILEMPPAPQVPDATVDVEGIAQFQQWSLPADIQTEFDAQQAVAMESSLAEADEHMRVAQQDYDTQFDTAVSDAEQAMADASSEAQRKQEEAVGKARGDIQKERQAAIDTQKKKTKELDGKVDTERRKVQGEVDSRVRKDQREADTKLAAAQRKADDEIKKGESQAKAKEKEAEDKDDGFWGDVVDAIGDAISAITDAIVKIWDDVRAAVNKVLDEAVEAAKKLIDGAITFISSTIGKLVDLVGGFVCDLLDTILPELADKLRGKLEEFKTWVDTKLNEFGTWLKEKATGFITGLKDSFNKLADAIEGAVAFATALATAVVTGDWSAVADMTLNAILALVGISREEFDATFGTAEGVIRSVIENPGILITNAVAAVSMGFEKFGNNFIGHFASGAVEWITGALTITMPERFDISGIFDIAMQVLGLTPEYLKEKAESLFGKENVEVVNQVWDRVEPMVSNGWQGLWDEIQGQMGSLWDEVIGGMTSFLVEKAVIAGARMLASMATGVGAIVEAIIAAYNFIMWLRDNVQRIMGIVTTVVNSVADFVGGKVEPAAKKIEAFLGGMVPIAIDLLAKLLGLGGIPKKVRDIIMKVRKKIDDAVESLIKRIRKMFGADTGDKKKSDSPDEELEPVKFAADADASGEEEPHTLSVDLDGAEPRVMLASTEAWLQQQVTTGEWKTAFEGKDAERKKVLELAKSMELLLKQRKRLAGEANKAKRAKLKSDADALKSQIATILDGVGTPMLPAKAGRHGALEAERDSEVLPDGKHRASHHVPSYQLAKSMGSAVSMVAVTLDGFVTTDPDQYAGLVGVIDRLDAMADSIEALKAGGRGNNMSAVLLHQDTHLKKGSDKTVHAGKLANDVAAKVNEIPRDARDEGRALELPKSKRRRKVSGNPQHEDYDEMMSRVSDGVAEQRGMADFVGGGFAEQAVNVARNSDVITTKLANEIVDYVETVLGATYRDALQFEAGKVAEALSDEAGQRLNGAVSPSKIEGKLKEHALDSWSPVSEF